MLKNYFKVALKVLARRKVFTFISLFGISFTLLVLTVVTAMMDHMLAPAAPESLLPRSVALTGVTFYGEGSTSRSHAGYKLIDQYARGLQGVERLSIVSDGHSVNSYVNGQPVTSTLRQTDGEFWQVTDFTFLEGAPYSTADVAAARFVAVINTATRERFFGEAIALGRTIEADGQRFQVVGVVPNVSTARQFTSADIYVPLTTAKSDAYKRELMGGFNAIAVAGSPDDLPHITAEFNARMRAFTFEDAREREMFKHVVAPFETTFDRYARMAPSGDYKDPDSQGWKLRLLLVGLALLFMLLPAVNLVNLNMSRILERSSEIGVRKAFGASSRTLVVQFVIENVLLTVIGGLVGFVLSFFVLRLLSGSGLIQYAEFTLNLRVFLYGFVLAIIFGLLSGVYPAWRMSRLHPVQALKGASR